MPERTAGCWRLPGLCQEGTRDGSQLPSPTHIIERRKAASAACLTSLDDYTVLWIPTLILPSTTTLPFFWRGACLPLPGRKIATGPQADPCNTPVPPHPFVVIPRLTSLLWTGLPSTLPSQDLPYVLMPYLYYPIYYCSPICYPPCTTIYLQYPTVPVPVGEEGEEQTTHLPCCYPLQ